MHDAEVLIAVREDYFPQLEELKEKLPNIFRTTYRLMPLTVEQARAAITKPADRIAQFGGQAFTFTEDAIDEILNFLKVRIVGGKSVQITRLSHCSFRYFAKIFIASRRQDRGHQARSRRRERDASGNPELLRPRAFKSIRDKAWMEWAAFHAAKG